MKKRPHLSSREEMSLFHDPDYLKYLEYSAAKFDKITPDIFNQEEVAKMLANEKNKDLCFFILFYFFFYLFHNYNIF